MPDRARRIEMTVEEFLKCNLTQDERYELVDGVPVRLRAMTGSTNQHDAITVNLIAELRRQLKSTGCRPTTADAAVRTKIRSVRRPDVTIESGPVQKGSLEAGNPVAVFEVLSPTTRKIDRTIKLEEYRRHPTLTTIVHIDPDFMDVLVYTRDASGAWNDARLDRPDDVIEPPALPAALSLGVLYEDIPLPQEAGQDPLR